MVVIGFDGMLSELLDVYTIRRSPLIICARVPAHCNEGWAVEAVNEYVKQWVSNNAK